MRKLIVAAFAALIIVVTPSSAAVSAGATAHVSAHAVTKAQPAAGTTGWRFRKGNITVQAYTRFYGACHVARVWTTGGYLKPGLVTRAALFINTECNTKTLALGLPVGLAEVSGCDFSTVMSCAGFPTVRDFRLVEQIYPW